MRNTLTLQELFFQFFQNGPTFRKSHIIEILKKPDFKTSPFIFVLEQALTSLVNIDVIALFGTVIIREFLSFQTLDYTSRNIPE